MIKFVLSSTRWQNESTVCSSELIVYMLHCCRSSAAVSCDDQLPRGTLCLPKKRENSITYTVTTQKLRAPEPITVYRNRLTTSFGINPVYAIYCRTWFFLLHNHPAFFPGETSKSKVWEHSYLQPRSWLRSICDLPPWLRELAGDINKRGLHFPVAPLVFLPYLQTPRLYFLPGLWIRHSVFFLPFVCFFSLNARYLLFLANHGLLFTPVPVAGARGSSLAVVGPLKRRQAQLWVWLLALVLHRFIDWAEMETDLTPGNSPLCSSPEINLIKTCAGSAEEVKMLSARSGAGSRWRGVFSFFFFGCACHLGFLQALIWWNGDLF